MTEFFGLSTITETARSVLPRFAWLSVLVLVVLSSADSGAGPLTGRIEGEIKLVEIGHADRPFPNVPVKLIFEEHNRERVQHTSDAGEYVFNTLPLGKYTVRPDMKGYRVIGGKPYAEVTISIDKTEVVIPPFYLVPL